MDNLILPDNVLNQQVCTECLNYLSVGPVVVSREGKIICGRCSDSKRTGAKVTKTNSLYNLVAAKCVFQCINHYEGCRELLLFNEAIEHEQNCKKNGLVCPFCKYKGNGCQLIIHFDKKHPEYVLKEDTFKIMLCETVLKRYILVKGSNIFCLWFLIKDASIEVLNLLITPSADVGPRHFKLRFFKSDSNIEFVSCPIMITDKLGNFTNHFPAEMIECNTKSQIQDPFLLDKASLIDCFPSGRFSCKIELIDCDIKEYSLKFNYSEKINRKMRATLPAEQVLEPSVAPEFDKDNFNINCILKMSTVELRKFVCTYLYLLNICVCCEKYIETAERYFCPKYHVACKNCQNSKCTKCNKFCYWQLKPTLNIALPCEWDGCQSTPVIFNYMLHKRDCKFRRFKCPDADCDFEGVIGDLKTHWHLTAMMTKEEQSFSPNKGFFWHIPTCNEIFFVTTEFIEQSKELLVTVDDIDVALPAMYKFHIFYYSCRGLPCVVNKLLKINENVFSLPNCRKNSISMSCLLK